MPFDGKVEAFASGIGQSRTAEILSFAKSLIADERHWTQGRFSHTSEEGVLQRCAIGAVYGGGLMLGAGREELAAAERALAAQLRSCWQVGKAHRVVQRYNDSKSHREVIRLFDRAIVAQCHKEETFAL